MGITEVLGMLVESFFIGSGGRAFKHRVVPSINPNL